MQTTTLDASVSFLDTRQLYSRGFETFRFSHRYFNLKQPYQRANVGLDRIK
jgi:hypothetical protein